MLGFFKRLLRKEEPEQVVLKLGDARDWFLRETEHERGGINAQLTQMESQIRAEISDAMDKLAILENAALKNPNIPQRALDVMEGNRKSHIKRYREFLSSLVITSKPEGIEESLKSSTDKLKELEQGTQKSYLVMQEFFAHESREAAMAIRRVLMGIEKQSKHLNDSAYPRIKDALEAMLEYNRIASAKQKIRASIAQMTEDSKASSMQRDEAYARLEKLKGGPEFSSYKELVAAKEELEANAAKTKGEIENLFSGVLPAMKRQSSIPLSCKRYIESPYEGLKDDASLEIVPYLNDLQQTVSTDAELLNEKRKERFMESMGMLGAHDLKELRNRIMEADDRLAALNDEINRNRSMQDYNEIDYRIKHLEGKISGIEKSIQELKDADEGISFEDTKKEIVDRVLAATGKKIRFA